MTALEIIRLVGSEFEDIDDDELGQWVEIARPFVSKEKFGKFYEQALAFMVCHMMKMGGLGEDTLGEYGKMGAASGMAGISSISDGGSSISFSWPGQTAITADAVYAQTTYGRQYLALLRLVIVPITIDH